jgi:prepilin-type N-terminal cleavage/methylation domain-containing protein
MKLISTSRTPRDRQRGLGLVELLVAIAVAGIIMVVVAAFFAFQSRIARDTQARNEINVRARAVAEAIIQDLRLAGARAVVDTSGRAMFVDMVESDCSQDAVCVAVDALGGGEAGTIRAMTVWYASSLFLNGALPSGGSPPTEACRRVDYSLTAGTLYRSDAECVAGEPDDMENFANDFADSIQSVVLWFVCGDDGVGGDGLVTNPTDCFGSSTAPYVREARVDVTAVSERRADFVEEVSLSATLVNLRSPTRFRE